MSHPARDISIVTYSFCMSTAWVLLTIHASRPDAFWPFRVLHTHRLLWILVPILTIIPALLWPVTALATGAYYTVKAIARKTRNKDATTNGDVEMNPVDRKRPVGRCRKHARTGSDAFITLTVIEEETEEDEEQQQQQQDEEEQHGVVEERDLGDRLGEPWAGNRSPSLDTKKVKVTENEFV